MNTKVSLFDSIDGVEETTVSGNEDTLDLVENICKECLGLNDNHSSECNADWKFS